MELYTPSLPTFSALRAEGWRAKNAKEYIDTVKAYLALDSDKVRIRRESDDLSFEILSGDMFDPEVMCDIQKSVLEREEKAFIDRINRDGVYWYCAECFDGKRWNETWSSGGFVGSDFEGSGYDTNCLNSLIDAVNAMKDAEKFLGFEERVEECACN